MADIKIKVTGTGDVISRLDSLPESLRSMLGAAVNVSIRDVQDYARQHHRYTTRTGTAERSISTRRTDTRFTVKGEVGTTSPVTLYLHQGTRPHEIKPKHRTVLRWAGSAGWVFAKRVYHPGTAPDSFIYNALDAQKDSILKRIDAAVDMAMKGGG